MEIRRAREEDIGRICELLRQVLDVHAAGRPDIFRAGTQKYSPADLLPILADDGRPVFVSVGEDGTVTGYVFCVFRETRGSANLCDRKELYIDDLCVDAAFRRAGVGTALYRFAAARAREAGCSAVTLNVWHLNPGALAFYEALGMRPLKTLMEERLFPEGTLS